MEKKREQKEGKTGATGPILMCPFCKVVFNCEPIHDQSRLEVCPTCGEVFWFGAILICHWDFEFLKSIMKSIQQLLPQIEEAVNKARNGG